MNVIFAFRIPEERRREISGIAQKISQEFILSLRGASGEDDMVELIYEAFRMMYEDQAFAFVRKADWDPSLKPDIQRSFWDPNAIPSFSNEDYDVSDHPNKRKHGKEVILTRNISQSAMPSPAATFKPREDTIKTPRPNFTIGLRHSSIAKEMMECGLSKAKADEFLKFLQRERKLCSDPTQNFLDVRFPVLVIEGKAYATRETIFEAQNQAAVSGACMVNLRQQLNDISHEISNKYKDGKTRLAFSICTEGPQIEFWVHYALSEDGMRCHYMNVFRTCHGSLQSGLETFLIDVDRLMGWTKDEMLNEIAYQLTVVADYA
ncbi:MAG: hypothetical protein Q9195_004637 [Heterodermia aff. obscurata]